MSDLEKEPQINGCRKWCEELHMIRSDELAQKVADDIIHTCCGFTEEALTAEQMIELIQEILKQYYKGGENAS